MEFVKIDPAQLSVVALLLVIGGLLGWRFLGVLEKGLWRLAEVIQDFSGAVRRSNEIDEKQTDIIERLDQRMLGQSRLLDQTIGDLGSLGHQMTGLVDAGQQGFTQLNRDLVAGLAETRGSIGEQLNLLISQMQRLEVSLNQMPIAVQEALQPVLCQEVETLIRQVQFALQSIQPGVIYPSESILRVDKGIADEGEENGFLPDTDTEPLPVKTVVREGSR